MTVGIDDGKFQLVDNFPGIPKDFGEPDNWGEFLEEPKWSVGAKIQKYQDTNNGFSVFVYLQYHKGAVPLVAIKGICGLHTASVLAAGGHGKVSNDFSEIEEQGPICVALGTGIDEYYGWFWCGGVCPVDTVPGLDGIFPSDGTVTAGFNGLKLVNNASATQFRIATASTVSSLTAAMSFAVDTTS